MFFFQVASLDSRQFDVLFVGTNSGRILKLYDLSQPDKQKLRRPLPVLVESMQVFPPEVPVRNLMVARSKVDRLVTLSEHEVLSLPVSRCGHVEESCGRCLALRDPHCAWHVESGKCVEWAEYEGDEMWQELEEGRNAQCEALTEALLIAGELSFNLLLLHINTHPYKHALKHVIS